ncbi:conserved hypothetical protein [Echinococcus multilocularis]|uniref:Uncharacterized protein n=1 Tax=Echinococcus multilocularis TaxID=6211 RepID=A0A087VZB7_ECHMU|nr:conserved hypothetical protein [Echinococcus multilocularis]
MWKHLILRRRVSTSGLDRIIAAQNSKTSTSLRNKVFVISELKIVNISPHLYAKRHSSMQTEENSLRKENVGFCQKKSLEISKLVTLTIRPRICLLTESTAQVGAVTEAVSTQTLDVRERKNKDLLVHANFQNYEPILESKKLKLLEILQSNQPCECIKGKSTKQSQPAGPRTFGYGDCQSSASNTANFEELVEEKRCKETSILMAALEEELNCITDSIKVCHNSGCSPNKRRRLNTRCNPPKADQYAFTDEMLQNATSELIKELERVRMGNSRRNEIPLSSSAKNTNQPMLKSCLPKVEHDCVLADGQTKHQVDLSSTSMCLKSQIKTDSRKTVEEVDNQKTQQSNQELEKVKCLEENRKLSLSESEGTLEPDNFDWLGWVRRVTHDETLTPQQKDWELDRVVNAMIEQQNKRIRSKLKANRPV